MIRRRLLSSLLATALLALATAAPAHGAIDIESFTTTSSDSQAGGHPDLTTSIALENPGAPEVAKNLIFEAPEGVFGNPNAISRCTASDFALKQCSANAQAGIVTIYAKYEGDPEFLLGTAPLIDMVPEQNETARFNFVAPMVNIPIAIPVTVRTGSDYGLRFTVSELTQQIPARMVDFTVWGMPALTSHDLERFPKGSAGCPGLADTSCISPPTPASIGTKPLINYPTICTGEPLVTKLIVQSYLDPTNLSQDESSYPPVTGCEKQTFNPVLSASLTTDEADSPSGLDLGFKVPQTFGFTPSPSEAKTVIVTLPPDLTINPDAADGQTACSDAQANFKSEAAANCPDRSKVGTVSIGTPALDGPLTGSLYIAEPKPGDQYRLFLIVDGFGIHAKLVGSFHPDPQTGQLTAAFENLPQVPFEEFDIHLFASDRGLMATPTHCTQYPVKARFVPWNGVLSNQNSEVFVSVASGPNGTPCPGQIRPFEPRLVAGTSNPNAGAFSDFHLKLDRDDGDQFLGDLNFRMPPGFTGDLRGISYCPETSIAAAAQNLGRNERANPSCPASSQIGTTNVAAGPGGHPFHAVGKMYLSGPFQGAPLSLAAITPALAGPYDYGVVVVRVALDVDPLTAQVSARSQTMPQIIGGIPIRMRSIQVNIDRPEFTINPTKCTPMSVDSQGIGDQGTVTDFSSYFHVVNCATLPFRPKMTIRQLGKRNQTKRSRNPRLRFDLWTRGGDANIEMLAVTLPKAFAIDQRHLGNICSKAQLEGELCEGRQPIGNAWVKTPLLDEPLKGPAYAVSGFGKLPRVAFVLDGQVTILPQGESSSVKDGHLKTVVPVIPDAPVGHFRLILLGGNKGYLVNTRDLCATRAMTDIRFTGHNGKLRSQRVRVKIPCGKERRARRSGHRRR
jgi:hypothetical protein